MAAHSRTTQAAIVLLTMSACGLAVLCLRAPSTIEGCPVRVIRVAKPGRCGASSPPEEHTADFSVWEKLFGKRHGRPYTFSLPAEVMTSLKRGGLGSPQRCLADSCFTADLAASRGVNSSAPGDRTCISELRATGLRYAHRQGQGLKCAVVGSGGVLKGRGCGPRIDEADVVFRANDPPLVGFEADVGHRSDILIFNRFWAEWLARGLHGKLSDTNDVEDKMKALIPNRSVAMVFRHEDDDSGVEENAASWMCDLPGESPMPYLPSWDVFRIGKAWDRAVERWFFALEKPFLQRLLQTIAPSDFAAKPTTGMQMFLLAATLCDEVQLYGFRKFNGVYHYYAPPMAQAPQGEAWWAGRRSGPPRRVAHTRVARPQPARDKHADRLARLTRSAPSRSAARLRCLRVIQRHQVPVVPQLRW
jgi:hypothetical protein